MQKFGINTGMITTTALLYHQRHKVLLLDTSGDLINRGYNKVYSRNLTASKGTDNQIIIDFINQEQKRVDITGIVFTCRIISYDGESLIIEKDLEIINPLVGQAKLVLTEQELEGIIPGKMGFSLEQNGTGINEPVYVDENAESRGVINIVDSIMPKFVASPELTIPAHASSPYVTSIINTEAVSLHTFQLELDNFTGSIDIEGAASNDNNWYTISTENLVDSSNILLNAEGYHNFIRFTITETSGTIIKIIYR